MHAQRGEVTRQEKMTRCLQCIHFLYEKAAIMNLLLDRTYSLLKEKYVTAAGKETHARISEKDMFYLLVLCDFDLLDSKVTFALQYRANTMQFKVYVVVPCHLHTCKKTQTIQIHFNSLSLIVFTRGYAKNSASADPRKKQETHTQSNC